jgi:hypothetical protein
MTTNSKTIEVTLAKAHTHQGKTYAKGKKIKVSPTVAQWLYDNDVAINPAATQESK